MVKTERKNMSLPRIKRWKIYGFTKRKPRRWWQKLFRSMGSKRWN